ncbi:MAG: spore germination protein GerPE [Vulcanibacillus sp.]
MKLIVHQSIFINSIRVGGLSNSSVFQIGSAGIIKSNSNLYNTGQFTVPAEKPESNELPVIILPSPKKPY